MLSENESSSSVAYMREDLEYKNTSQVCLLEFRKVPYLTLIYTDAGSRAKQDLATFRPDCGDGWFYLGPCAVNSREQVVKGLIVRELEDGILANIIDWEPIWSNVGGRGKKIYSLWRGVTESPDYVVIGDFFVQGDKKPTSQETKFMKAVHRSVCREGTFGSTIWMDRGTRAPVDTAIWRISAEEDHNGICVGAFVATIGYKPTERPVYMLDYSKIMENQ